MAHNAESDPHWLVGSPLKPAATGTNTSPGCEPTGDAIPKLILALLRAAGGKMPGADLMRELGWRGIGPERAVAAIDDLVARELIRGPIWKCLAYELTVSGWDACTLFAIRLVDNGPNRCRIRRNR